MVLQKLDRPSWRGRANVDALTIACIERAESMMRAKHPKIAHTFRVTQGSYQNTVKASAGTHDGGGAVDLSWCGHDQCIRALREAGMAAWHRTPEQGPWSHHIHAVVVGHPRLAPSAARQISAYLNRRNGLANNRADDGPQLTPIPVPVWPWPAASKAPAKPKTPNLDAAEKALAKAARANRKKPGKMAAIKAALAAVKKARP